METSSSSSRKRAIRSLPTSCSSDAATASGGTSARALRCSNSPARDAATECRQRSPSASPYSGTARSIRPRTFTSSAIDSTAAAPSRTIASRTVVTGVRDALHDELAARSIPAVSAWSNDTISLIAPRSGSPDATTAARRTTLAGSGSRHAAA